MNCLMKSCKSAICYHCNIKLDCIKHKVSCLFMQCRIINICNKSGYPVSLTAYRHRITDLNTYIIRMHTVNRYLIGSLGKCTLKQACFIYIIIAHIYTDCSVCGAVIIVILFLITEEILIYIHPDFLKSGSLSLYFSSASAYLSSISSFILLSASSYASG